MATTNIVLSLLIVFVVGKIGGELFERLGQPAVVGELIAGVIAGPAALGLIHPNSTLTTVSTMGVIILMFTVGLETRASSIFRVGKTAMLVATLGVIVPFGAGYLFGMVYGFGQREALFAATALVATSVGITARVLSDKGYISTRAARIILAAAVIDDILGMVVLSIVTGLAKGDGISAVHLTVVLLEVIAFVAFEMLVAPKLVSRHGHWLDKLRISNAPFVVALVVMLAMAAASEAIGLAGIVGAFFAGMMFAETNECWELDRKAKPLYEWLVPYFFVLTGAQVDVMSLIRPDVLLPGLVLVVIAVATKVVGCGLGALGEGRATSLAVAVGMVPRGEVGLIVASAGLAAGIMGPAVYAMVVLMVTATTLVVPPLLPRLFAKLRPEPAGG